MDRHQVEQKYLNGLNRKVPETLICGQCVSTHSAGALPNTKCGILEIHATGTISSFRSTVIQSSALLSINPALHTLTR